MQKALCPSKTETVCVKGEGQDGWARTKMGNGRKQLMAMVGKRVWWGRELKTTGNAPKFAC